jgi:hypothetical protein
MMETFLDYDKLPIQVQEVLGTYDEDKDGYKECERLLTEVEKLGYTFEYYLDAIPFNFRKP